MDKHRYEAKRWLCGTPEDFQNYLEHFKNKGAVVREYPITDKYEPKSAEIEISYQENDKSECLKLIIKYFNLCKGTIDICLPDKKDLYIPEILVENGTVPKDFVTELTDLTD